MPGISSRLLRQRVSHEKHVEDGAGFDFNEVETNIPINIQPISDEPAPQEGETLAYQFYGYLNLKRSMETGDRIKDANDIYYYIQGVEHHDYGMRKHTKLKLARRGS